MRWLAVLVILTTAFIARASSSPKCELSLIQGIFNTDTFVRNSEFTQDRDWRWYKRDFQAEGVPSIVQVMRGLPKRSVWFDSGTGAGRALLDVLEGEDNLENIETLVGSSYDLSPWAEFDDALASGRFHFVKTGLIGEAIANLKHPIHKWKGKVNILTDELGPWSYFDDLQSLLNFYADLLVDDGYAFVSADGRTRYKLSDNDITHSLCKLAPYIPRLTGGRLRMIASGKNDMSVCVVVFQKVAGTQVEAPLAPLRLELVEIVAARPPHRTYRVVGE